MTSTIFEVGPSNLWTGAFIVIDDEDGAPIGWTRAVPPHLGEDEEAVFSGNVWIAIPRQPPPLTPEIDPDPVPESVTPAQAKTALYNAGLYDRAEAAVGNSEYALIRIWWNSAQEWKRSDPYIYAIAAELGLDDDAVDDLFRAAGRVAR